MKDTTLAYLAGIMDADGFFTIKRNTYAMRVRKDSANPTYQERLGLKQVQPEAVKLIHKHFGGYYRIDKPNCKNGKPLHSVGLSCRKAIVFIEAILPFLQLKQKQTKILLCLRKSIEQGRKGKSISQNKNRWGKIVTFKRHCLSESQIIYREGLIVKLNSLNDTRIVKEIWRK